MRFVVRLLAVVGLLTIVLVVLVVVGLSRVNLASRPQTPIADGAVLTLTVAGPFAEASPSGAGLASALGGRPGKLREIIAAIEAAASDSRIKGLVLKLDASPGMAQTQELKAAIKALRGAGKFVYAFADDYSGAQSGAGQYYLAAACDQIWLQPMGEAMLTDVAFETPFLKGAFAKLDVDPEFVKRAEYKTAPETFTESGYTPAAREMMEALAGDLTQQLVMEIASGRGLAPDDLRALLAKGSLTAEDAVKARLIDHVGYADEVVAAAKKVAGADVKTVALTDYYRQEVADKNSGSPNIALIYEVGTIDSVGGPIDPDSAAHGRDAANAVIQGLARAMAEPSVKAIVLRVDSPGGSVSGSETIRRMVVRAKQAGKKIVVSMGSVAASGGYWISADADKIVADPATLTGSIGVFSGKFDVGKGLADIGVTTDRTAGGPFTGMNSPFTAFTPDQTKSLNQSVDAVYDGFVSRVADGRRLPRATVAGIARGRVWTGQQAKGLGLVDQLGGLEDAIALARDVGGVPAGDPTRVAIYPEPISPIEALRDLLSGDGDIKGEIDADARAAFADLGGPAGAAIRVVLPLFADRAATLVRLPELGAVR
jgi:protease-4